MKNKQTGWIFLSFIVFVFTIGCNKLPTTMPKKGEPLKIINEVGTYEKLIHIDSNQQMMSIQLIAPSIILDLRYASENNFMHRKMYPANLNYTFLRLPVIKALAVAQINLNKMGYGLKIFDAYRPYAVTKKFWELVHDEKYVANPEKGSGHNRGTTVDLTLVNLKTKEELEMGTNFDNFTDTAHQSFKALPSQVIRNRALLKNSMESVGFKALETEWWHYSWISSEKFDVLNLTFEDLLNSR